MQTASGVERAGEAGPHQALPSPIHESFLSFAGFRFLKLAGAAAAAAIALYAGDRPYGSHYGGSWAGYALGTAAALMIVWLTWFGYRKRAYPEMRGRLAARLSAHVYFGLCVVLVATLHTGFHFGLNIHTLAYVLMCLVVATGIVGVCCYVVLPRLITDNRAGMTMQQMLGRIASLDDELRAGALPLAERAAAVVQRAAETTAIGGRAWQQLSGRVPDCATAAAIAYFTANPLHVSPETEAAWLRLRVLLEEKALLLARVRRDVRYKAIVEAWLYLHVPLTFMLLAALAAHILSIFFLW